MPAFYHTASGDIIQMSLNTPKVMGDYLCNSHLPISELQVFGGGMKMGMHSCVCINRVTKREELFWTFKVLEVKVYIYIFFFCTTGTPPRFWVLTAMKLSQLNHQHEQRETVMMKCDEGLADLETSSNHHV